MLSYDWWHDFSAETWHLRLGPVGEVVVVTGVLLCMNVSLGRGKECHRMVQHYSSWKDFWNRLKVPICEWFKRVYSGPNLWAFHIYSSYIWSASWTVDCPLKPLCSAEFVILLVLLMPKKLLNGFLWIKKKRHYWITIKYIKHMKESAKV